MKPFLPLAAIFFTASAWGGETLCNGIVLPDKWPPLIPVESIRKGEPMPVPYLEHPPAIIPVDVGRQLFVDDFLIENTTLARRFHAFEEYEGNPILKADKRWEIRDNPQDTMAFSDGAWFDPQDGLFKIWYLAGNKRGTCYASSKDGLHWEKPVLDVQPGTNVVLLAGMRDSSTVWLDHDTTDPAQRFKLIQFQRNCWKSSLHTSPDGIHWSGPTWCGKTGDRTTMFYNPFRKMWVINLRCHATLEAADYNAVPPVQLIRYRKYFENRDFLAAAKWRGGPENLDWRDGDPVTWVGADRLDNPPGLGPNAMKAELYNVDPAPYESLMVGYFCVLEANPSPERPKINQVRLGFSRDGFHWSRPSREPVLRVGATDDTWNAGNVQSVGGGGIVVGDRIFIYHSGRTKKKVGAKETDLETTGVAFLRRDGFASMEAKDSEGVLTTRPVKFSGRHLFVNVADAQGELRVEILDGEGKAIAPFTKENCLAVSVDKTLQQVNWKGGADLSKLAGQPVRLRFHVKNGALYSFWISPDADGASHGFVAAGGPGFTGATDTVGVKGYEAAKPDRVSPK